MKRKNPARIHDLVGLLHNSYPPLQAEEWDNVGLLIGDPAAPVERVLVSLDVTEKTIDEAEALSVQAVLSHHPLIFRPFKNLTSLDPVGRLVTRVISGKIAIIAAHTNLDSGRDGLNDWLAAKLGVHDAIPLQGSSLPMYKLIVYVPSGYESSLEEALFAAGAGTIGAYERCSFSTAGTGRFRPGQGSSPFIGQKGEDSRADESRIEMIVSAERLPKVIDRLLKAHPYETPAYDVILLQNRREDLGGGRIGRLQQPLALQDYAQQIGEILGVKGLRVVGDLQRKIEKVALCSGSGASMIHAAQRQGADLLVTGDLKYHDALNGLAAGLALVDAGHFATEQIMVEELAQRLRMAAGHRSLPLEFIESTTGEDPFQLISPL